MAERSPELVLLPGLDGTGLLFARLVEALDNRVRTRVVAYPPDKPLGYEALAARVADSLGPERVVLLGESFSGPVAVMIAARWPDRVAGLILAGTFTRSPLPPFLVRLGATLKPRRIPDLLIRSKLMGWRDDPALFSVLRRIADTSSPSVIRRRLREIAAVDVGRDLARVGAPVLVLHGDRDRLVPQRSVRNALQGNPRAAHRLLDAPHMVLQFRPAEAAREIAAFVRRIGSET